HGLAAGIAVMIAVSAMACQFALLRLALPGAISTAVMTGNLTNAVFSLVDLLARRPIPPVDWRRFQSSFRSLLRCLLGCIVATGAVSLVEDWAWSLPVLVSAAAVACVRPVSPLLDGSHQRIRPGAA